MTHLQPTPSVYEFSNHACLMPANNINIFTTDCRLTNDRKTTHHQKLSDEKAILRQCCLKNKLIDFILKGEVRNLLVVGILILAFSYLYAGKSSQPFETKTNIGNNKITDDEALNISPLVFPDKYMLQ